ncbi:MAG: alpha/beta fold hydrolase, partial [Bacteroidota bacterium]|nr:alpha/beta fold hydrolase [Bacteroidota bacterium]MDX5431275.1 alpha/beta fold hydrolase [Bacteroidota bacterium]MDX5470013.1 alpha/beta fold hydrolase [Bacteroidota bacterium]
NKTMTFAASMQLFHKEYPGPGKPLIIMHGLFGMLDNWHNLARKFSENFHVFLLDLRNHGQSPHSAVMNYPIMADDLWEFMQQQGLSKAYILGHSMGGKVAMEFALKYPDKCDKLIVVDIAPVNYKPGHNEVFEALFNLDISNGEKSRKELDQEMTAWIQDFGTRQFLLKSLVRKEEGGYYWKFNLPVIHQHYSEIIAGIEGNRTFEKEALFLRGGKSRYVKEEHHGEITQLFPNHQLHTIEDAGHWVHAEKPTELIEAVTKFLLSE